VSRDVHRHSYRHAPRGHCPTMPPCMSVGGRMRQQEHQLGRVTHDLLHMSQPHCSKCDLQSVEQVTIALQAVLHRGVTQHAHKGAPGAQVCYCNRHPALSLKHRLGRTQEGSHSHFRQPMLDLNAVAVSWLAADLSWSQGTVIKSLLLHCLIHNSDGIPTQACRCVLACQTHA
jgi:hypothetical protein